MPLSSDARASGWCDETLRALDRRYLDRPPATSHRPYFGFVLEHARDLLEARRPATVLDLGCANGSFLHFLLQRHPKAHCTGVDALCELVDDAARQVAGARFLTGDVRQADTLPAERFALVTMLTLHSHFDDLEVALDNLLSRVEKGGRALVFGAFNPVRADLRIRIRVADYSLTDWLPGWNVHARATVAELLRAKGFTFRFHDYLPPLSWPERPGDLLGSRRAVLDGCAVLVNDAGVVLPFALLEVNA